MSFDVSPIAGFPAAASPVDRTRPSGPNERASFTDAAGAARTAPAIPAEVWDQVDAASRLAQNLDVVDIGRLTRKLGQGNS